MEFLLLWADDLDDVLGVLRHLSPRVLPWLAALALFALAGVTLVRAPHLALTAIALILGACLLVEAVRRRLAGAAYVRAGRGG